MERCLEMTESKYLPFMSLTGDQPVDALILELKNENPSRYENIIPFLGAFHLECAIMSTIYKRFVGSGFANAGIVAEKSVNRTLHGKHYLHCLRAHNILYEVLTRRVIENNLSSETFSTNVKSNLKKLADLSTEPSQRNEYSDVM